MWMMTGALAALAASTTMAATKNVLSDLFYTTATPCASLRALPTQQNLRTELVPSNERFHGSVTLSKSDTSTGCALHVAVRGDLDADDTHTAFALTRHVDASLAKLLAAHVLRGSDELKDLTLQRLRVKADNRDLTIDAVAVGDAATGEVTLNGDGCDEFASKRLLDDLLAGGIGDVAVVPGQVDIPNCAIGLDIMGRAPAFRSATDAVAFLKTVDASLNDWFGSTATKQSSATLRHARMSFSPPRATMLEAAVTTDLATHSSINAPTKSITMGILMGLVMLTAMLVGIAYQKKRHEHSLQLRHNNASRAAQIRRVSYRMGYEPVGHKEADLEAEEEEKDGLL